LSEALDAVRGTLRDERAWLVGGAVRDRLLGRDVYDLDIVVDGEVRAAARHLALEIGGPVFELSDRFGAWRVIGPGRGWHADLTPLRDPTIEQDLAQRDFTVNAIAEPLLGGALIDPHGGAADLGERRLRMVGPDAFTADPLRSLRLARLACELGLEPEPATLDAARAAGPQVAGVAQERVFAELRRIVLSDAALAGLALMDEAAVTAAVLPELDALRGVEQTPYHHRDVHGHTLEVLQAAIDLERDPAAVLGDELAAPVTALLAEPLADELTRGGALRFGALLHDVAKPATRTDFGAGRVGFPGHDELGAAMARDALARLRTSERLRAHVAALTRHHLRLGFLVHNRPLSPRDVYRYLTTCAPVEVDVTLLSVADRLATRGRKAEEAIAGHLELAREILREGLAWRAAGPRPALVRGDELASALGIGEGPRLGPLLDAIAEAHFAGEVSTPDDAIALARRLLEPDG
jgi:putative nucleotidyltransferase with HDIG domain